MATLEYLQDPRQGITRAILQRLLEVFELERPPQALKQDLQQTLAHIPLVDIQEEMDTIRHPVVQGVPQNHAEINLQPRVHIRNMMSPFVIGGNLPLFLKNFERTCLRFHVPENQFATELHSVLPNQIEEVLARLPDAVVENQNLMKVELYKHFDFTPGSLRQQFQSSKKDSGESYVQFGFRLKSIMDNTIKLSESTRNSGISRSRSDDEHDARGNEDMGSR
jgi:hypothetical protein